MSSISEKLANTVYLISSGQMAVWSKVGAGGPDSSPETTDFLKALDKLVTFLCPCSPSSANWYQQASRLGGETQSALMALI